MKTLVLTLGLAALLTLLTPTRALADSLSLADVLRANYEVVAVQGPATADVLRAPYEAAPLSKVALADVLRAPYAHH